MDRFVAGITNLALPIVQIRLVVPSYDKRVGEGHLILIWKSKDAS
jgi:hypothetical protein